MEELAEREREKGRRFMGAKPPNPRGLLRSKDSGSWGLLDIEVKDDGDVDVDVDAGGDGV